MIKLKKFIAAAVAAAAMGAVGVTAFAASTFGVNETVHGFKFDIGNEINEIGGCDFSLGAQKNTEIPYAEALVSQGNPAPSRSQPLTLYVVSHPNTLPKYHATEPVDFYTAADNYVKTLPYLSGQGKIDVEYYLCAICGEYNLKVSGLWCP